MFSAEHVGGTGGMMRFLSLLLLGLCPCVVSVVMWSSLVCL